MCAIALIVVHVLSVAVLWGLVVAYSWLGTTDALSVVMMKRYRAVLWLRHPDGGWYLATSRTFRRAHSARRQIHRWLAPHTVYPTRQTYHRDVGSAPYGDVVDARNGRVCESIGPPVVVVPSIADTLG